MKVSNDKAGVWFKGLFCELWGGVYLGTSNEFFRGSLPDISRCIKCDSMAGVVVEYEEEP